MQVLRGLLVVAVTVLAGLITVKPAVAIIVPETDPPSEVSSSPLKVSAYGISLAQTSANPVLYEESVQYVELYNSSTIPVDPSLYRLRVTNTQGGIVVDVNLSDKHVSGYIAPGEFLTVGFNGAVTGVDYDFSATPTVYTTKPTLLDREIQLWQAGVGVYAKAIKLKLPNTAQTRLVFRTITAEEQASESSVVYNSPLYNPLVSFPLAPIEIVPNPADCTPAGKDLLCSEYVKFYNSTDQTIDFSGTRLRVGYPGQSSTASNTIVLADTIRPGEYVQFEIGLTNTGSSVWLEDEFGLGMLPGTQVSYDDSTNHKGQSWAFINGIWQWASVSPGLANIALPPSEPAAVADGISTLQPCRSDQERNPDTNRCRLVSAVVSTLAPCAANQERSPETNRCRSTTTLTSSLTPCRDDQIRNSETNRCKSITSANTELTPCSAGQERNPDTNRCRKSTDLTMPHADYPVKTDDSTPKNISLGWLAFATVGVLAVGYGIWEWRTELRLLARRILRLFKRP